MKMIPSYTIYLFHSSWGNFFYETHSTWNSIQPASHGPGAVVVIFIVVVVFIAVGYVVDVEGLDVVVAVVFAESRIQMFATWH